MATPLERKLLEIKNRKAVERLSGVLEGLGIPRSEWTELPPSRLKSEWSKYLAALRDDGDSRRVWPEERASELRDYVDLIADDLLDRELTWFAFIDGEILGLRIRAAGKLLSALDFLVSPYGDLMLATDSASDGLCIELNRRGSSAEFEIVTWGAFTKTD